MSSDLIQTADVIVGERINYDFNFEQALEKKWRPGLHVTLNQYIRPHEYTGREYQAVAIEGTLAQTGQRPPKSWPRTIGGQVVDGTVTWEALTFGLEATDLVSSSDVAVPSEVTLGAIVNGNIIVTASLQATVIGTHRVTCTMTSDANEIYKQYLDLVAV